MLLERVHIWEGVGKGFMKKAATEVVFEQKIFPQEEGKDW